MKCIKPLAAAIVASLAILLAAMSATGAAAATSAVTVTGVNMRAGPGTSYPAVVTLSFLSRIGGVWLGRLLRCLVCSPSVGPGAFWSAL